MKEGEIIKKSLIIDFYNASQLPRSFGKKSNFFKKIFKENSMKIILNLFKKIDNNTLKNRHIRESIKKLSKETKATIGQSQKIINVCLKYYTFLVNRKILK